MNFKKISLLIVLLLIADQALKIWIKTHMTLDEAIMVVPTWFQLRFIENNGAAFGMRLATGGAFDWGKLALSLFRLAMIGLLGYYLRYLGKRKTPAGVLVGLTLILAGAIGNMIDRGFRHYVVDFFWFSLIDFPVFNIADIYVVCGGILLAVLVIFHYKDEDFYFINHKG